jgi:hypothetical protein
MSRSITEQYTDEIHQALKYWATWLPGTPLKLGDCGPVDGRVFTPEASLSDFGITFDVTRDTTGTDLQHASEGAVNYRVQLSGGTQLIPNVPQGSAGLEVTFAGERAVVFVVRDGLIDRIANVHALTGTLLSAIRSGDFPREYAVVTQLVTAGVATVLISNGNEAGFSVTAKADFTAGLLDLASAQAGLTRVSSHRIQTEVLAERGITPLFKLVGFKRQGVFWGRREKVAALGFGDGPDVGDLSELAPADTDDG